MRAPKPITEAKLVRAVEADDYKGFCRACGASRGNTEPDARNYPCDNCGRAEVFGAEELLMMGFVGLLPKVQQ